MVGSGVTRAADARAVTAFLDSAAARPSVLVVEGEAGIGKTTLWLDALEQAHQRGFRVLSARAGQAESGLTYAMVADLLEAVDTTVLDTLPHLQRVAIDRVLLQGDGTGPATDERVVASAFLTLLDTLSATAPVIVAIDDTQWLDSSSQAVVAFAARRLKGRIGVLVTERTEADGRPGAEWLRLSRLDGVERLRIGPLSLGGLRKVITARLGRALSRPAIVRISELSGGNPFYALELARALDGQGSIPDAALPGSLADLVRSRLDQFGEDTQTVLLAAASVATPTVDVLAEVTHQPVEHVVELLEAPENNGIVQISGNRVRFAHPLLARGVYSVVGPARRRQMHRTLAEIVEHPELRARHLALAASSADPSTLLALDTAADSARGRGAPAAAAELLDLAINLGGDTPERLITCAEHHFRAGESERAEALLKPVVDDLPAGPLRAAALNLLAAIRIYDDSLLEAIELLDRALDDGEGDHVRMVRTLLLSSFAHLYSGKVDDSVRQAELALERARGLALPELTSQVLAMSVLAKCMRGDGVDEASLQRAVELEDADADLPIQFRASAVRVITQAWTGQLEEARRGTVDLRQLCLDRGAESDMMAVAANSTLIEIWRGDFAAAALVADEAIERAEHIDTQHVRGVALTSRATVLAHTGRADDARADARAALDISMECGTPQLGLRALTLLGFVEVSLANYAEAVAVLQPLIDAFELLPGTEIRNLDYAPDAIEAMIGIGQITESEPMIEKLEANGRRLDRPWLLATGARCRAMWWSAKGDVDRAMQTVTTALAEHDRIPMPFERARTLLLLGQLQRRQRLKQAAANTFAEAHAEFERMGAPLWAARVRDELDRTKATTPQNSTLTPTEKRIADLATSGLTNREVAATLFVSLKTVEANLTQIYRKLGIRSRAQLASRLTSGDS
jgi:ATP/maltotriose-dependent transcriptional regulator MalT